jgi:phenylalanyl-tRNA synthetase beta chain
MNVPLEWINQYINLPKDLHAYTEKMSMIGHMLDKTINAENDTVIDLELRGNRADCYSIIGIARETYACYPKSKLKIPELKYDLKEKPRYKNFSIKVESDVVDRFYSCIIKNVKIKNSPDWMSRRLRNYGMDTVNNVVDITNYVMIEGGMPLHAFDMDKISGDKLFLTNSKDGGLFTTFDGGEINLTANDVVFSSEKGEVYGLVGIVGSKGSGIGEDTVDILLECAAYDRRSIRTSMFRHNIHTEAGLRHSHDLHRSLCEYALNRAVDLIMELAADDKTIVVGVDDYNPQPSNQVEIDFHTINVKRLCGVDISVKDQMEILKRLDMEVDKLDESKLVVKPPLYRTDINLEEDIVEEIVRIFGYEKIEERMLSSEIPKPIHLPDIELGEKSRDIFFAMGLDEVVTVPFVSGETLQKLEDPFIDKTVKLLNPPVSHYSHMRTSMFIEHLNVAAKLINRGADAVTIFEVGRVYFKDNLKEGNLPYSELNNIEGICLSLDSTWDFFAVKGLLEEYFSQLMIKDITFIKNKKYPFAISADIFQNDLFLGELGIIRKNISYGLFGMKANVLSFSVKLDSLVQAKFSDKSYMPYSQFPPVYMDMSIDISHDRPVGDVLKQIKHFNTNLIRECYIKDVFEKENKKSVLIGVIYQSKTENLDLKNVQKLHEKIKTVIQNCHY